MILIGAELWHTSKVKVAMVHVQGVLTRLYSSAVFIAHRTQESLTAGVLRASFRYFLLEWLLFLVRDDGQVLATVAESGTHRLLRYVKVESSSLTSSLSEKVTNVDESVERGVQSLHHRELIVTHNLCQL